MIELIQQIFQDHTLRTVVLGTAMLGIVSGCLGSFAVLRQQSLLGDAIAHAALPGVALAFLLTNSKAPIVLLIGAAIAGWIATMLLMVVTNNTRIKKDATLGMILSVFFGFGLMLLTIIQRLPDANKAGLNKFLFGSAATLLNEDIAVMFWLGIVVLSVVVLLWKEFKVLVFDYDFAKSLGLPVHRLDILLTSLIVVAIVIGLQTVGVILMSAMLVAPAAAARQWTDRLGVMVFLSSFFGATAAVLGALASSIYANLPTGPVIVLFVSVFVFISFIFAPHRGLLWDWVRLYENRRKIRMGAMLKNLLLFSEIPNNPFHPHDIKALQAIGRGALEGTMKELQKKGYVAHYPDKRWALTPQGLQYAQQLVQDVEGKIDGD